MTKIIIGRKYSIGDNIYTVTGESSINGWDQVNVANEKEAGTFSKGTFQECAELLPAKTKKGDEEMKHNVGDRVRVHSLKWFEQNCEKTSLGSFKQKDEDTVVNIQMASKNGCEVTIHSIIDDKYYTIKGIDAVWTDWMFEEDDVKEETNWEHYQQKIAEFIKTKECENCPAYNSCDQYDGASTCGLTFANWAMSKYVQEEPKPVYRAWTKDTFPLHIGAEVKEKGGEVVVGVTSYHKNREKVWLGNDLTDMTFSDLFANYEMSDGTPCGELVRGEETK